MPRIFEYGLPGFQFGMPDACCVESFRDAPLGNHALVKGANGVGKTASVIDPFLTLLKLHVKTDRKTSVARYMREHDAKLPYIYYVDMLIDGQKVDPNLDMVLAGFYIDNTRLDDAKNRPQEHGFHFLVQHSSSVWTDAGDQRPVYERLGIPLVEHHSNDYNRKKIADIETARRIFSRDTPTVRARTYNIKSGSPNPEFIKHLSEATRYDFASALPQCVELSTSEGGSNLQNLSEASMLDKFLFNPIQNRVLPPKKQGDLLKMLTKSCEDDLDSGLRQSQIRFLTEAERRLEAMGVMAESAAAAQAALKEEKNRIQALANALRAGEESKNQESDGIHAALETNARNRFEVNRHIASSNYRTEQSQLRDLAMKKEQTEKDLATARAHANQASLEHRLARASDALEKESKAKALLAARDLALTQFKENNDFDSTNDIDLTLHLINDEEIEKRTAALSCAMQALDKAKTDTRAAHETLIRAEREYARAETGLESRKTDYEAKIARVREKLAEIDLAAEVNDFGFVNWPAAERKHAEATAAHETASELVEKIASESLAANKELKSLQEESRRLCQALDSAKLAEENAKKNLEALEKEIEAIENREGGSFHLASRTACEESAAGIDRDIASLQPQIHEARAKALKSGQKLAAAEEGTLMLPEGATRTLEAAGVKARPATDYIADMDSSVRSELLRRVPSAAACVVVEDELLETALRALSCEGDEWFAGAVGVLKHSEIRDPRAINEGRFAAHPDAAYIVDRDRRTKELFDEAADLAAETKRLVNKESSLSLASTEISLLSLRWYEGELDSLDAYKTFREETSEKARKAEAAVTAAVEQEAGLQTRIHELDSALYEAKEESERCRLVADNVQGVLALRPGLETAAAAVEEAKEGAAAAQRARDAAAAKRTARQESETKCSDEVSSLKRDLNRLENRLMAVPRPASGSRLEDMSFDELYELRPLAYQKLAEQKPELDILERQRNAAQKHAAECGLIAQRALEELDEGDKIPAANEVAESELYRLEQAARSSCLKAESAKLADDAATKELESKQGRINRLLDDFRQEYAGGAPLRVEEIMPQPQKKLRELDEEQNTLETARRELDASIRLYSDALNNLIRRCSPYFAIAPDLDGDKESLDESSAEKLTLLVDERINGFVSAQRDYDAKKCNFDRALGRHNASVREKDDSTLSLALVIPRRKNSPTEDDIESTKQALQGALLSLKATEGNARIAREALVNELDGIGRAGVARLSQVQARGNGEFRFTQLSGSSSISENERLEGLDEWLARAVAAAGELAQAKGDPASRHEHIESYFKANVLNAKCIIAQRLGVAQTALGDGFVKIRSPRAIDKGRFILWKDLKNPSGGEKLSARLRVIAALMSSNCMEKNVTSIMMVDTLFGGLSDDALIEPVFQVLEKSRIQLIVVEDRIRDEHINARFPHITTIYTGKHNGGRAPVCSVEKSGEENMVAFFTAMGKGTQGALF